MFDFLSNIQKYQTIFDIQTPKNIQTFLNTPISISAPYRPGTAVVHIFKKYAFQIFLSMFKKAYMFKRFENQKSTIFE